MSLAQDSTKDGPKCKGCRKSGAKKICSDKWPISGRDFLIPQEGMRGKNLGSYIASFLSAMSLQSHF